MHNPDLVGFSDESLIAHFRRHGEPEGRRPNSIGTRDDFVALIPDTAQSLEIGPFHSPVLRGRHTKYFDVLPKAKLIERAQSLGIPHANVPEIDFVSLTGDLTVIGEDFEYVLSSHSIEHQPDLVTHLQNVERLLRPGGRYFVLIPDKRYCFDHFLAESSLADVLDAYREKRTVHSLASVLEHRVLTTHNDSNRHWANDHGGYMDDYEARTKAALEEFAASNGTYIDVHAWTLTPSSAAVVLTALNQLGYTGLTLERLYPTRRGSFEFWLILRR